MNSLREGNITHIASSFFLVPGVATLWRAKRGLCADHGAQGNRGMTQLPPALFYGIYFLARRRWQWSQEVPAIGATLLASLAPCSGRTSASAGMSIVAEPFVGRAVPAFNVRSMDGFPSSA